MEECKEELAIFPEVVMTTCVCTHSHSSNLDPSLPKEMVEDVVLPGALYQLLFLLL